jgi:LPS-assembly lipoprotein
MEDSRYKMQARRKLSPATWRAVPWYLGTCIWFLLLNSCGFHLRGLGAAELAPELRTLRVEVQGSGAAYDPLREAMRSALQARAGVTVVETGDVPVLTLSGEGYETRVLSVSSSVKAAEYLVMYRVHFRVTGADGVEFAPEQTISVQRDYAFDPVNVLAKEREEQELRQTLRQDAVQQVLRRLGKMQKREEREKKKEESEK